MRRKFPPVLNSKLKPMEGVYQSSLASDLMIPFTNETCGCIPAVSPAPTIPDVAWQTPKEPQPTPTPTSGSVFDNTDATLENGDSSSGPLEKMFSSRLAVSITMGLWMMSWIKAIQITKD